MPVKPVVRYMILCEDWEIDATHAKRINIHGLLSNIRSLEQPPFPLLYPELCVLLVLTETRGSGKAQITVVFEESGQTIFSTAKFTCTFGDDPLEVVGVPFRIKDCVFPQPGLYTVQFWYNDEKIEERPLRLR